MNKSIQNKTKTLQNRMKPDNTPAKLPAPPKPPKTSAEGDAAKSRSARAASDAVAFLDAAARSNVAFNRRRAQSSAVVFG